MYGVIDIGSNTIRFKLYQENDQGFQEVMGKKSVAGLASYVEEGVMREAGMTKLVNILKKFDRIMGELGIEECHVFATAAVRNAKNSQDILDLVEEETGFSVDLLSGQAESYCDYWGVVLDQGGLGDSYIIDIGGGSTEIIAAPGGKFKEAVSIPEGSLSLYQKNVQSILPKPAERKKIHATTKALTREFSLKPLKHAEAYGVGGTIRSCGNIIQELYGLPDHFDVSHKRVEEVIDLLVREDHRAIRTILQVSPDRVHTQVPGMLMLDSVMTMLNIDRLTVSDQGVREGYLWLKRKGHDEEQD